MTNKAKNILFNISDDTILEWYERANKHKAEKEYVQAIEIYSKIVELKENNAGCTECAKLYENIGDVYFELKDYQRAFENM